MIKYRYLFLLFISCLLANACELDNHIDIALPEGNSFPIIEAYLVKDEPLQILVSKSNTLQEPVRINVLWNASVHVIFGEDSLKLKNLIKVDQNNAYLYNYLLDTIVTDNRQEYKLCIDTDEFGPITATCQPLGDVEIEQLSINESGVLELSSRNLDNPFCNYYQLRCLIYTEGELTDIYQRDFDFHEIPAGPVDLVYPLPYNNYDSLRVDLYRVDYVAYTYHRSISNAVNSNIDPFTTPSPFRGNISNGWGIFTFMTRDSRTMMNSI
jgi:Domain of unknown function (DUF4249)